MTRDLEDVLLWVADECPPEFTPDRAAFETAKDRGLIVPGRRQPWVFTEDGEMEAQVFA